MARNMTKLIQKTGGRLGKQSKSQSREDKQPLLKDNLTDDVPVRTTGDTWVDLGKKLAQEVLSRVTRLENASTLENRPSGDLTKVVELAVSESISQLKVDFGHTAANFCLKEYLSKVLDGVFDELQRQGPGPREACVRDGVEEALHRFVFIQLNHTLQCDLLEKTTLQLIQNVAKVYLSDVFRGDSNILDRTSQAIDPLVIADWLQSAQMKYLDSVKKVIPELLGRILQHEEQFRCSKDPKNEEDFISLQLDVEQVLTSYVLQAKCVSQCLMERVQEICYQELLLFIKRYVKSETKHLKQGGEPNLSSHRHHQFRTFNTCTALKKLVQILTRETTDDPLQAISLLGNMQTMAQELLLEEPLRLAQASLKNYFNGGELNMTGVMCQIEPHFENLPLFEEEAYKTLVDTAHRCISSLYFGRLLLSNRKALEKQWDNVGARVRADAICLSWTFSRLSNRTQEGNRGCHGHNMEQNPEEPTVTQRNQMLLKVAELMQFTDVEALKIASHELQNELSLEQLHSLLHWKGGLSKKQVRQVMGTSHSPSEPKIRSTCLRFICCR